MSRFLAGFIYGLLIVAAFFFGAILERDRAATKGFESLRLDPSSTSPTR
jgi:hypothetical protein